MPWMLDKRSIPRDNLNQLKWFAETVSDCLFSPGATQETLEENLMTLREVYKDENQDGIFLQFLSRLRRTYKESDVYRENNLILRIPYTYDDFIYTEEPYKELNEAKTAFERGQLERQLADRAKKVGVKGFTKLCNQYDRGLEQQVTEGRMLSFPLMKGSEERIRLDPGDWHIDRTGIWRENGMREELACSHPIAPVGRLINIDTGEEKLVIAFERNGRIRYITKPKQELFDSKKVIALAAVGVAVTSRTAPALAEFLNEIEGLNYELIPEQDSTSRLGFLDGGLFSPYTEKLVFDGAVEFGGMFRAISSKGKFDLWLACAAACRRESVTAQIMLAASFASVLIGKFGALPFFVHLWGVDSGTGKTVALMLAASVWGNPEIGQYPQTFNATQVGMEKTAAFLNNIPLCIDELQLSKDSRGKSRFDVYQLAQGTGRTRGNKQGGIDKPPTWSLCILTTGESPIVQGNAGAGAVNRVIDIECKPDQPAIRDGRVVCKVIRQNYGHAGRRFVESLTEDYVEHLQELYDGYFRMLTEGDTTEKQAAAAALLLTADVAADELIFQTGRHLTVAEISDFLKTKASISAGERGYAFLCDWVAMNIAKFAADASGDCYGTIDGDYAYINRTVYRRACEEAGFDERALLSWLKVNQKILTRGRNLTRGKRINGLNVECIALKMDAAGFPDDEESDDPLL